MTITATYVRNFGDGFVTGLSVDADGYLWALTSTYDGTFLRKHDADGTELASIALPTPSGAWTVAVAPDGDFWLGDRFALEGPRLWRVSADGTVEDSFYAGSTYEASDVWYPGQVAVGPDGKVYLTSNFYDPYSDDGEVPNWVYLSRALRLSAAGEFEADIGQPAELALSELGPIVPPDPRLDGTFVHPGGIALDSAGNVYVSDCYQPWKSVSKFAPDGTFLTRFGETGDGPGQFAFGDWAEISYYWDGMQVAVDASDRIYVTDLHAEKVNVYADDGTFLLSFANADTPDGAQMYDPFAVACGPDGAVYVGSYSAPGITQWQIDGGAPEFQIRGISVVVCGDTDC